MTDGPEESDDDGGGLSDLHEENEHRRRLYRLLSDPSLSHDVLVERLLDLGRERLGVANGHLVAVDRAAGTHEVVAASGSDIVTAGDPTDLSETFCRETVDDDAILAVYDADEKGWGDDPAHEKWGCSCYIGSQVRVGGELYGTVCFVDADPRPAPFSAAERTFVDLLSRSVSQVLERRSHERTLQHQRELFELFVEEVSDYAIFVLDPGGQVASWNTGARLLKGYEENEIVGEHFSTFYPEAARERGLPARLLEEARRTGRAEHEGWRVRADGSRFWALVSITALYDDDGTIRGFGKVTRDLTDRREARRKLEAEREFTERALDALEDLFFVMDAEGRLERVNQRVLDVLGRSEEAVLSMEPSSFFVPADSERVEDAVVEVLETGEASVEGTLLTGDGERRRYEFRARRLTDGDGTTTGIVGIGRDITDRRLHQQRLEVAQRVLRHDLRNELNALGGWVETLAETATPEQRPALDRLLETTERLAALTEKSRSMSELASPASREPSPVDVAARVEGVLERFRSRYPDATVESGVPASLTATMVVDEEFELAVENAVENAIEHNPAAEPWVRVDTGRDDGAVRVEVADDGPLIPDEERAVLDEGGEDPLRHGSGMGLWLIHWCVTAAGGTVSFAERASGGNRITMRFPTAEDG